MSWFVTFDRQKGEVPSAPIFEMPSIADDARFVLESCTDEHIEVLQCAIDDLVSRERAEYVSSEIDQLAIDIHQNRLHEVSYLLLNPETATVEDVRRILTKWEGNSDGPLLPSGDDIHELDVVYEAALWDDKKVNEWELWFALLALKYVASYVESIRWLGPNWNHVMMPLHVARLLRASNDAVLAARALSFANFFDDSSLEFDVDRHLREHQKLVKHKLSVAGLQGAAGRKKKYAPLVDWALSEAKKMSGSDRDISRRLSSIVPMHLADISKDSVRLIYDAIRARNKRV